MFLCFERDFLTCLLLFFRKSEFFCRKGVGWNEFRQPLSYYGISERNVRFWSLNSRLDNRQADNPFMAMRERYFYGVLPFSSFCRSSWRKWNRADDSPLHGKGRSSALAAWLKESPHIRIKPRVWRWMCGLSFLRHNRLYHLRLLFLVESGIVIGTANHLPLTGEPQKVVRTAEAWEECPYVSVRTSRIGIYGHTSFVGFGLFTLSSESPKVTLFMFSCSFAFWRCSIQSASCYAYLHFATSRRRIRWSFSFGRKGNSGICRKSKVKPPVLREKSPALRVVFF